MSEFKKKFHMALDRQFHTLQPHNHEQVFLYQFLSSPNVVSTIKATIPMHPVQLQGGHWAGRVTSVALRGHNLGCLLPSWVGHPLISTYYKN